MKRSEFLQISEELLFRVQCFVMAIPTAERVQDGDYHHPDGIDAPGWEAAGRGRGAKLEGTEADHCEVVSLGGGCRDDEQMDEIEMDDEVEERDAAEDQEDTG